MGTLGMPQRCLAAQLNLLVLNLVLEGVMEVEEVLEEAEVVREAKQEQQ